MIYFDNSATTRQYDEVSELMLEVMRDGFGNPSSLHRLGVNAEKLVKEARRRVAKALGAEEDCIYFTSGGTEADNTAILGAAHARRRTGKRIITTKVEHPAVLEPCKRLESEGWEVVYLDVTSKGVIEPQLLADALTNDTALVSVMAVNNETGAIMPIEEISRIIKSYNRQNGTDILFHSDLVQSFGKLRTDLRLLDMASVSAHKIHGPKGIGALYVRKGITIEPFMLGGGQERHLRSGTENVPAIAGFGLAAKLCDENFAERIAKMTEVRDALLSGLRSEIEDVKINTPLENAVPSVLNVSVLGTRGEVILHTLEQEQIYVSTGSACSSNHKGKGGSHVLRAMKLGDKEIDGALRFSFGELNTVGEAEKAVGVLQKAVGNYRRLGSFR